MTLRTFVFREQGTLRLFFPPLILFGFASRFFVAFVSFYLFFRGLNSLLCSRRSCLPVSCGPCHLRLDPLPLFFPLLPSSFPPLRRGKFLSLFVLVCGAFFVFRLHYCGALPPSPHLHTPFVHILRQLFVFVSYTSNVFHIHNPQGGTIHSSSNVAGRLSCTCDRHVP